jgi:hypothetical protein
MVRRKLAELELDVDRQQGWARGGTKGQVRARTRARRRSLYPARAGLAGQHCAGRAPCGLGTLLDREGTLA